MKKETKKNVQKQRALGLIKKQDRNLKVPKLSSFKKQAIRQLEKKKQDDRAKQRVENLKNNLIQKNMEQDELIVRQQQSDRYEQQFEFKEEQQKGHVQMHQSKFRKELQRLVQESDVILEVLDVRDPMGCRSRELEGEMVGQRKKVILVLNKIDLVPFEVAQKWQEYLKGEFPCLMFRANQQKQQHGLKKVDVYNSSMSKNSNLVSDLIENSKASLGTDQIMQLIKNYSKKEGIVQQVTVGVVGYPNVGKSSLINSLSMNKVTKVSQIPGQTRNLQHISLDSKVTLVDSPGVVFDNLLDEYEKVKRNIIKVEDIQDLRGCVDHIVKLLSEPSQLEYLYKLDSIKSSSDLLIRLSQQRGKLKKGGIPDLEATAKIILNDWMTGKIKYHQIPPNYNQQKQQMQIE